jgi:ABC-type antimicrobial peptide transport system permease subunit
MYKFILKFAIRHFLRNKFYTLINISGLAIGLACTLAILLWVNDEKSYDLFHSNIDNLYRVVENQYYAGGELFPVAVTPDPLAKNLKDEYPEITHTTRFKNNYTVIEKDDKTFTEFSAYVDPDFFEMFTVNFLQGTKEDALADLNSVVLTKNLADKYFDDDPLGKTLRLDKEFDFKVTAIIDKFPDNSHISFDLLLPADHFKNKGMDLGQWGNNWLYSYVLLHEDHILADLNEKIINTIKDHNEGSVTEIYLQPVKDIHLYSAGKYTADVGGHGDIRYVNIFILIAIAVLLIACINFMNLTTAKSSNRTKEIAFKKVVGSTRKQLIRQFIIESILVCLVAYILAVFLVDLFLPTFNEISRKDLSIPYPSWEFLAFSISFVIIVGLLSGSYPSFYLASLKGIEILKGLQQRKGGASFFRRILVVVQFSLSLFLIIGFLIISRQLDYMKNKKLGLDKDNIVYVYLNESIKNSYQAIKNELLQNPDIVSATTSNQSPTYIVNSTSSVDWTGKSPDETMLFHNVSVDVDYQNTFKLELKEGRFFSEDILSDTLAVVINEQALNVMGLKDPIGSEIKLWGFDVRVIGILKDFHFKSLHTKIEPLVMYQRWDQNYIMFLRINNINVSETISYIEKVYGKYSADNRDFFYKFLDEDYESLYNAEQRTGKIFQFFAVLAIFISCLGLYALASFMAERRVKEIGIRKANGASTKDIIKLLTKDFTFLVIISFMFTAPVAWYTMNKWLENFVYKTNISLWIFLLAGIMALVIAWLTVSYQSIKAAFRNPVDALRYE